jgi:putative transposase
MRWKQLLAYITGSVDQELLLRNEYLVTENRMLRQQIRGRVRLSDSDRKTLAVIGKKRGKQALEEVATIVNPDTILAWHRKLVAQKCDGFQQRKSPGRRKIDADLEALVVRLAREKRTWGYDRIVGALRHVGSTISDQTVGNILKRHGIPPAPTRKKTTTWSDFIRVYMDVLVATDFFTTEVWTPCGLVTYYVLFFIHLASRRVHVAGMTSHPDQRWMVQIARNVTMVDWAFLTPGQYLIHDRDGKFCPAFKQAIDVAGVTRVVLPPKSPDLNAYAERWVRSVKDEVLSQLILFGERSLRHALTQYEAHYHTERPHQGKGNREPPSPHSMNVEEPATFWGKGLSSAANDSVGSSSTTTARRHERFPDTLSEEDERRWPRYPQKIPNSNGLFRHVRWPCDGWPTTSSIPPCTGECKNWASGQSFSVRESTRNYSP